MKVSVSRKFRQAVSILLFALITIAPLTAMAGEVVKVVSSEETSGVVYSPIELGEEVASLDEIAVVEEIVSNVNSEDEGGIIVGITDDEVPMSGLPFIKEQKSKTLWLWAIIVGLIGSAGYEFYMKIFRSNREEC